MHCLTDLLPYDGPRLHAFSFPTDTAVFAVGDVHGQAHKLRELLDALADVPTPGKKRALVFLGDLVDRGPSTLGTLRLAATAARDYGFDTAVHLPGNHELMMQDALAHLCAGDKPNAPAALNWLTNGGDDALAEVDKGWGTDPHRAARAFVDALPLWNGTPWLDMLADAPSHLRVGDALFVHAGVDPKRPLAETLDLPAGLHVDDAVHTRHWAWVRRPFLEWPFGWAEQGRCAKGDKDTPGVLVVHGHTAPADMSRDWVSAPHRLLRALGKVHSLARLNLDAGSARGMLVAGAVLTDAGWRLAAADGLD